MKVLSLLGSTGSIGCNVLEVVRRFPGRFRVAGMSAGKNIALLASQVREFDPEWVAVADPELVDPLSRLLPGKYRKRVLGGDEGNCRIASLPETDMAVTAVVGAVGLLPTLRAIEAGKDIGLANKETLVMAGSLVMEAVREAGVRLLPIDSEHNAIFQALEAGRHQDVARIILTASGGPFRTLPAAALATVTPDQALDHPNWSMGRKISIDSATMMNKGLEVIEARWLFDTVPERIKVLVHPQSIVHSLVEYVDGSVVAQLGIPDMRIPIAYALSYPERLPLKLSRLSLAQCGGLSFEDPDLSRFPALALAYEALERGSVVPTVLNAANEVAVEAFLDGRITFTDISRIVALVMERCTSPEQVDLGSILTADRQAREVAGEMTASSSDVL